jgi:hypothetical protein
MARTGYEVVIARPWPGTYILAMDLKRSGPPTTHDLVMWRVPLSAPPSIEWQQSFRTAGESTTLASPKGVQFEHAALTFRSGEGDIPVWIECIDKWIAYANKVQADLHEERSRNAARHQQESDTRRQKASEANEKFKNL